MLHTDWPPLLRILLGIHIAAGVVAFVCAPVALATAKGGRSHRQWGKVYFWAMSIVAATALLLSIALPILFLALVSVFSFYAAFAAYRVLFLKQLYSGGHAHPADWFAAGLTFVSSLALAISGVVLPRLMGIGLIEAFGRPISIVSVTFGLIGMNLASQAAKDFLRPPKEKMFWWYAHLQGMMGSYIAAMTAFSAVNLSHWFGSAWWVWLWPTLIGVPAIAVWTRYYKRRFASPARPPMPSQASAV